MPHVVDHLTDQDGVIARFQAVEQKMTETQIRRKLRRREWTVVHPGVYVDHTGPLTWHQRAWAGVLHAWPAALSHQSALRGADGQGRRDAEEKIIHVAVDRDRHVVAPDGVRLHRMSGFGDRVQWNLSPPRIRYDDAILDLAAEARTDLAALATVADACGSLRTTARRLLDTLGERDRVDRRGWLGSVLVDIDEGTCSVLEHGYLVHVERPHGLPTGRRQQQADATRGSIYRDVLYEDHGLVVELDGRAHHSSVADRDRDLDRDLDAAVDGLESLRIGYGQVFERACATAARVGRVLQRRGWPGPSTACPTCAPTARAG